LLEYERVRFDFPFRRFTDTGTVVDFQNGTIADTVFNQTDFFLKDERVQILDGCLVAAIEEKTEENNHAV
jgi:hypothetical protein